MHETNLARKTWRELLLKIAEAETAMYLNAARQLVEAGHVHTAQTMCFARMEECAKRYGTLFGHIG